MNDFLNEDLFTIDCDLIVIPISTEGKILNNLKSRLEKFEILQNLRQYEGYKIGDLKILSEKLGGKHVAIACISDEYDGCYYLIRSIAKKLAEKAFELKDVKKIAIPILEIENKNIQPFQSVNIMRSAFYENKYAKTINLIFCSLDDEIFDFVRNSVFEINKPSSQLVLEAEIPKIRRHEFIEPILYASEFYYKFAVNKYIEFLNYEANEYFYEDVLENFKDSGLKFRDFVNSNLLEKQTKFTTLCGELVAYIDYNAYHKNIWNEYPDKRTLAKSAVRQDDWFINFIKFKKANNNFNTLSLSIKNAFYYLENYGYRLTMLSDRHRKKVFELFFPNEIYGHDFDDRILSLFHKLDIQPRNYENFGATCTRILYLPFIKAIWDDTNSKSDFPFEENIGYTDLKRLSFLIQQCLSTKSKVLDLGKCGLTDLTIIPELSECTHIERLILSNEWAEYKSGKWRKLTSLNHGNPNKIRFLPEFICNLTQLKVLICGGDWNEYDRKDWNRWGISSLVTITKLNKLEYLNLSNNMLKNIVGLNKLTELKSVHLNNNEIVRVEDLNNLKNLKELYISNNKIKKLDFISNLKNIETIDLHNNYIKDLRSITRIIEHIGISNDKWEVATLNIAKNPLEFPPMEIINLGKDAVLSVLDDIKKRGQYVNKDIKIILVGNSEVGKSTLVKYLDKEKDLEKEHLPTLWMDEKIIKSKYLVDTIGDEALLHIFDFGGHDYYHDTHHLFYSTNTIYILIWDAQTNNLNSRKVIQKARNNREIEIETQDYPIKYWLDSIEFYTKGVEADNFEFQIKREITYDSQLLIIQNKVEDASKILFLDSKSLKKDYSFIYDNINISLKPKRNLDHFDNLFLEMLNKMNILGAVLPKFYEEIKNSISIYQGRPVLSFAEFMDHCNTVLKDPINTSQTQTLLKYLNHVGIVLYKNGISGEKIYIDKDWMIENVHRVLEKLMDMDGEFGRDYVVKVLGKDDSEIDDLILVMVEFKIIFKHPYLDNYIAPLYLPRLPDGKINLFLNDNQICYRRFEYKGFIHKNVILSIFQHYGNLFASRINKDIFYYWKDGLILKNPNTDEIVMIKFYLGNEEGNACIDIYHLSQTEKHTFIDEVLEYIRKINEGYKFEEMVTIDGNDYISIDVLEQNAKIGKHIFSEKKLSEPLKMKPKKLFKLKDYIQFIKIPVKKKKVVISYSKKDLVHVHTLKRYLQPLIANGFIEDPWYCSLMNPADVWDEKIKQEFKEADIIFFMISEYFYNTIYIIEKEIKTAIDRYNNNENIKIIPVILEFYDWQREEPYNLQKFSALPYQAKPISDFSNPKIAWNTITASVKVMIEKDLDPGKIDVISKELEDIYERLVKGDLN
ncbi:MAG: leucine-rich repeat domain-containing protein [Chryseobacterium sp.]|jgi:Leucine-rich repeat (LRR) protein|uniref:leucine-rich repeat domain-containing protein n=1 Tax=Chryseobacterium sp. TaxID=1871047 RepID=UPI002816D194|nr:leucine-rich repeat domain-containing protein [Chryseobacterium sp.]MDR2234687.1 leucine-rich repeat domain-containing protein [Chryseobacterium sp.]